MHTAPAYVSSAGPQLTTFAFGSVAVIVGPQLGMGVAYTQLRSVLLYNMPATAHDRCDSVSTIATDVAGAMIADDNATCAIAAESDEAVCDKPF